LALSYESSSPERYLPALPAVAIGFGYAIGSADFSRRLRIPMAVLFCLPIPANLMAGQAAAPHLRVSLSRVESWMEYVREARETCAGPLMPLNFWDQMSGTWQAPFTAFVVVLLCLLLCRVWAAASFTLPEGVAFGVAAGAAYLLT
jgi:hypothetical protein